MAFLRGLSVSKFGFGKVFVPSIASYSRVFGREDFSALRGKFEAISVNVAKQGVSAVEKVVQYQYSNDSRFSMVDEVIRLIKKYSLLFSRFGKHIQSTFLNYMKTYNSFHATKLFCCFAATSLLFNTVQCSTDNVKNVSNNDNLNASFVEPAVHAIPVFEDALLVQRIGAWIFDTILYTFLIAIGNVPLALLRVPQTLIIACTFVAPFLLDFLFHKINGDSPGKKAFGIHLVNSDNYENVTYLTLFLRKLCFFLNAFFCADFLTAIFVPSHRCLHDMVANTRVVKAQPSSIRNVKLI